MAAVAAAGGAWAGRPGAAEALRQVELRDGRSVEAWEFDVPLRVVALRGSVPGTWPEDFRAVAGRHARLALEQRAQLADIYSELTTDKHQGRKQQSAARADLVTLGDAWLAPAIQHGVLQPIPDALGSRWWELLPPRWKQLVRRDGMGQLSPRGQVWGAPYRWGCTLVAYQRDKLDRVGHAVEDWVDLLQPALRRRIGVMESPREMMSIALRTLGLPPHAGPQALREAGISEREVADRLQHLRQQVLVVSNREATRALSAGDIWALVGWSEELVPLALRSRRVRLVAPASGTTLWADLWVAPGARGSGRRGPSPLLPLWLELPLQPARSRELNQLRKGVSPLLLPDGAGFAPGTDNVISAGGSSLMGGFMPANDVLQHSDFTAPVDAETHALYTRMLASL